MPTFHQRYLAFLERRDALPFGKKQLKGVSYKIADIWNKKFPNEELPRVESKEGDEVFTVRDYPDSFIKTMDAVILYASNLNRKPKPAKPLTVITPAAPKIEIKPKRERKRIPLKLRS